MSKMNPEIKARWLTALRGGGYEQGDGYLQCNGRFCCLGVLCDLINPTLWRECDEGADVLSFDNDAAHDLPPTWVKKESGLDWTATMVEINGIRETLYDHNDAGRTFAEIAQAIEEQL